VTTKLAPTYTVGLAGKRGKALSRLSEHKTEKLLESGGSCEKPEREGDTNLNCES